MMIEEMIEQIANPPILIPILAVERDDEVFERETAAWTAKGIKMERAYTMQEAIRAVENRRFAAVFINADNINYLIKLKFLRDIAPHMPILPVSSNFSDEEYILAVRLGADSLFGWRETTESNINTSLAYIGKPDFKERDARNHIPIYYHKELLVAQDYKFVFFEDQIAAMGKVEYELLLHLMKNKGRVFSYEELAYHLWGENYYIEDNNRLFQVVKRLKRSLRDVHCNPDEYIENVNNMGYRLRLGLEDIRI